MDNVLPIFVTSRSPEGAIGSTPTLSLQVDGSNPTPVEWVGGLGVCPYLLTTSVCSSPGAYHIQGVESPVASTAPSCQYGLLQNGLIPLSNIVTSHTCIHFIARSAAGLIGLVSVRPDDLTSSTSIVWSYLPEPLVVNTGVNFYLVVSGSKLLIVMNTTESMLCYYCVTPEHMDGTLPKVTQILKKYTEPFLGSILAGTIFDDRPLLVIKGSAAHTSIWMPNTTPSGLSRTPINIPLDSNWDIARATIAPGNPLTIWMAGSDTSSGSPVLLRFSLPDLTLKASIRDDLSGSFLDMAVTPSHVYLCGGAGIYQFAVSMWESPTDIPWSTISTSGYHAMLVDMWSPSNLWNNPSVPAVLLGIHVVSRDQVTVDSTTLDILTTEHLSMATMIEIPSWSPGTSIPPTPRPTPIWDDRVIYEAPYSYTNVDLPVSVNLIPLPPQMDLVSSDTPLDRLDPTGTIIVNLNPTPTPGVNPHGFMLATESQVYSIGYPSAKMEFPSLYITAPIPTVALLPATLFPLTKRQIFSGIVTDPTPVTSFKAIRVGDTTFVSLIALNAQGVYLGPSRIKLPPVLTDYPIVGYSDPEITAYLFNPDHTVEMTITVTIE